MLGLSEAEILDEIEGETDGDSEGEIEAENDDPSIFIVAATALTQTCVAELL